LTIEHNGLLVASAHERAAVDSLVGRFAEHGEDTDELHLGGSLLRFREPFVEGLGLGRPFPKFDLGPNQLDCSGRLRARMALICREQIGERLFQRNSVAQHLFDNFAHLL
jgi:hypothetical protein